MTKRLTSSQIQSRLERVIAHHPGCRDFQVQVSVRRIEQERGPHDRWMAEFHATGEGGGRAVCADALTEILLSACEDYALSLDS